MQHLVSSNTISYAHKFTIKNILQDPGKKSQDLASWQEICSKFMPTFGTCKNLAYLPRVSFQIQVKILFCLISGQTHK